MTISSGHVVGGHFPVCHDREAAACARVLHRVAAKVHPFRPPPECACPKPPCPPEPVRFQRDTDPLDFAAYLERRNKEDRLELSCRPAPKCEPCDRRGEVRIEEAGGKFDVCEGGPRLITARLGDAPTPAPTAPAPAAARVEVIRRVMVPGLGSRIDVLG